MAGVIVTESWCGNATAIMESWFVRAAVTMASVLWSAKARDGKKRPLG